MPRESKNKKKRFDISWSKFFSARNDRQKVKVEDGEPGPVAAHAFSGNLLIVLAILAFVVLLSWGSIHTYFVQRAEIKQVQDNISQLQQQNNDLNSTLELWKDDNYVKQQAKSRLFYVTEGETPYMVTNTDYSSSLADDTSAVALTAPQQSWTETLWGSFQESAQEGQETATPTPSETPTETATATPSSNG